ncbi:hypothetical protein AOQ84DRAFT_437884 [Glonium stellatum]|uniref:Uncharacterized protein n=1 Tax=Glonium stellatum TaxID=574774 RepID=A0A8E2JVL9_9PEZI|nr:hypothetical protein AOQ84DRAFT_437884 [Glonium stellatum]
MAATLTVKNKRTEDDSSTQPIRRDKAANESYASFDCLKDSELSGHAFKFLPVLGERIVDGLERTLASEYRKLWAWPKPLAQEVSETNTEILDSAFVARGGVLST